MAETYSLLEFLLELLRDDDLRADFGDDPHGTLAEHGLDDLSAEDVHDCLVLLEDNQTADFDREYHTGGNQVHVVPPPPVHYDGDDDHDAAVKYINEYVTKNYIDDRDTIVDNSINQQIDTGGGDFDQEIDIDSVVASGDGAVAAGDDISDSDIATGDRNVVGDDARGVTGDGNTTAFGSGDATSTDLDDVTVDDGGALAVNGNGAGSNRESDDDTTTTTTRTVEDSFNSEVEQTVGSYNEDNSENNLASKNEIDADIASNNDTDLPAIA